MLLKYMLLYCIINDLLIVKFVINKQIMNIEMTIIDIFDNNNIINEIMVPKCALN